MNTTTISFPGLGIGEFKLNKIAVSLFDGTITIRWYAIFICTGILLAYLYFLNKGTKKENIIEDELINIVLLIVPISIIGARLLFVLTSDIEYNSLWDVIAIWEGGLAIYGAIIFGFLTILVYSKVKKHNLLKILDAICPAVMIGQILGRWGNFFNGEAYGGVVSENSLWYFIRMGIYPNNIEGVRGMAYVHPTFLYESVWNLIGFIIINSLYKKKKFDGQILLMYITWYGFGRMLIEGLRTDSLYVGVFRISQVVGFLCFVIGAILLVINLIKAKREQLNNCEYIPTYAKISKYEMPVTSVDAEPADTESKTQEDVEPAFEEAPKLTEEEITNKLNNLFNDESDK